MLSSAIVSLIEVPVCCLFPYLRVSHWCWLQKTYKFELSGIVIDESVFRCESYSAY